MLSLQRELKILREGNHPFIINYIEEFTYDDYQWIVTDYMSGGTLKDILEK